MGPKCTVLLIVVVTLLDINMRAIQTLIKLLWKNILTDFEFLDGYDNISKEILIVRKLAYKNFGLKALRLRPNDIVDNKIYGSSFDLSLEGFILDVEKAFSITDLSANLPIPFSYEDVVKIVSFEDAHRCPY